MDKKKVFVIMPFKDEFLEVYEMLKVKFGERFEITNAGDEGNQQSILKDIIQPIYEADVVIADLTGLNANVMYELGLAHCFNKKTIVITQDDLSTLPFDLKQYRAKDYNTHFKKFAELVDYLEKNLNGAIDSSVTGSQPRIDRKELQRIISECYLQHLNADPPSKRSFVNLLHSDKIDVYDQLCLNWDAFVDYMWSYAKSKNSKSK